MAISTILLLNTIPLILANSLSYFVGLKSLCCKQDSVFRSHGIIILTRAGFVALTHIGFGTKILKMHLNALNVTWRIIPRWNALQNSWGCGVIRSAELNSSYLWCYGHTKKFTAFSWVSPVLVQQCIKWFHQFKPVKDIVLDSITW